MTLNYHDRMRRSDLIRELCKLSSNGWKDAKPVDYERLEKELDELNKKRDA